MLERRIVQTRLLQLPGGLDVRRGGGGVALVLGIFNATQKITLLSHAVYHLIGVMTFIA